MTRRTEGAGASCPVCAEPLGERPARCFRCETALGPWWEFEDALGGAAAPGRPWMAMASAGAMGVMLGIFAMIAIRPPPPPLAASTPPPSPSAAPAPAPRVAAEVLTYRVQRGDSLWRIASAITGDGRRWRELWPEHEGGEGRIAAGTVLRVDLSRLPSISCPPPADCRPGP